MSTRHPGDETIIIPDDITAHIKSLKHRSPSLDGIPNYALKSLPASTILEIAILYNAVFHLRHFPIPWKTVKIIPIHKPGKSKRLPTSYRRISLLNTLSKILERLILNRILDHVEERDLLNSDQFRLRKFHSTTQQLCKITDAILTNLNNKQFTAIVSLDLEKAFDTIYTDALIYRLSEIELPVRIIQLIRSYTSN